MNVFTFGYGGEHDADLLRAVGEAGNGLFYYIDNADSIPESFCDCLGGLLSVAAQVRGRGGLLCTAMILLTSIECEADFQSC